MGAGQAQGQQADANFGPGAADAFRRALDVLHPGQDDRFGGAASELQQALQSGDLSSLRAAAQALEGLVRDRIANPQQAGGLRAAIAVLKNKIAGLSAASGQTDSFDTGSGGTSWQQFSGT